MNFSLNTLRAFIAVARAENVSAAAKKLGVTQPNLSRQMAALEKEVRLALFVRHSRGHYLTKQGEAFLSTAENIFGQLVQETDMIREKDFTPEGSLKVVSGAGMLYEILRKLPLFAEKFPKVHFDFSPVVNVYHLQAGTHQLQIGDSDIVIMPDGIDDPEFIQCHLHNVYSRIYAAPDYLKKYGMPKDLEDLKTHKLIMYIGDYQEILNKQFNNNMKNTLQPFMTVRNGPSMFTALLSGCGIGCYGYNQEIKEKNLLVDVFPDMPDQIVPFYYTYHRRLEDSPKVRAFHDFLKEEVVSYWERPHKD